MVTKTTKKPAAKKAKGEWESETIATWNQTDAIEYRAQWVTAPDGKKMFGIRQFIIRKDGTEQTGRAGMSFPISDDEINYAVCEGMIGLWKNIKDQLGLQRTTKKPAAKKSTKTIDQEAEDEPYFVVKVGTKYALNSGKLTNDKTMAARFDTREDYKQFMDEFDWGDAEVKAYKVSP